LEKNCFLLFHKQADVMGFIYFWGLTIDTVSTINLLIAIGLTVDYSAHIAHTFMTETGQRNGKYTLDNLYIIELIKIEKKC
jgi:hypothetical protein